LRLELFVDPAFSRFLVSLIDFSRIVEYR
jgi:hypothetical protein